MKPKDLRDEFAIAALPTILEGLIPHFAAGHKAYDNDGKEIYRADFIAREVGAVADAMMAEREKN